MAIEVTVRHMDASGIQTYAREKAEELSDMFPRIENIHVILDVQKYRQKAEVVVQAKNHIRLEASDSADKMPVAVDSAFARMEKQLRKHRDKVQNHRVKPVEADVPEPEEI